MSSFKTDVHVNRAIDDAFAYASDPLNMPHWYSAVQAVRLLSGPEGQVGATYVMDRQFPREAVRNEIEIVDRDPPAQFTIRTISGPTPLTYRYHFSTSDSDGTVIELDATIELEGIAALAGPIAVHGVKRGMDANLAALKSILER